MPDTDVRHSESADLFGMLSDGRARCSFPNALKLKAEGELADGFIRS